MNNKGIKNSCITLPAIRGIQAKKEYFVVMCPLHYVAGLFQYTDPTLSPEVRAQRVLNKQRIPEMRDYILDNPDSYVFSSLTASVDGEMCFLSDKNSINNNVGILTIEGGARIIINDGQHRRAAIEAALKKNPALRFEHIAIVLYYDYGLKRSQQIFSDLNRYAIRPTKSLNILYNTREEFSNIIKNSISNIPIFSGSVETEKTTISNRSPALFTLSGIYNASKDLVKDIEECTNFSKEETITNFWNVLAEHMQIWQLAKEKYISAEQFRKEYICAHTIFLRALGIIGNKLIRKYPNAWEKQLSKLDNIDWRKDNEIYTGMVIINGKINGSRNSLAALVKHLEDILEI